MFSILFKFILILAAFSKHISSLDLNRHHYLSSTKQNDDKCLKKISHFFHYNHLKYESLRANQIVSEKVKKHHDEEGCTWLLIRLSEGRHPYQLYNGTPDRTDLYQYVVYCLNKCCHNHSSMFFIYSFIKGFIKGFGYNLDNRNKKKVYIIYPKL